MKVTVTGKTAEVTERDTLTIGSVGVVIGLSFSEEWALFASITAQFYNGSTPLEVPVFGDSVELPLEMAQEQKPVSIVLIGKNEDGTKVYPTVETSLGNLWYGIREGAEKPVKPSPDWQAQIEGAVNTANKTANQALEEAQKTGPFAEQAAASAAAAAKSAGQSQASAETAAQSEKQAAGHVTEAETEADRAKQEADRATQNILNGVDTHNQDHSSHPFLLAEVARVESIAKGRNFGVVFDTKDQMESWLLDPENVKTLEVGTNLYIRDMNTPDYWWDGTKAQELEVEHPDLTQYVTKTQLSMELPAVVTQEEYDRLQAAGQLVPGRIYYIDLTQGGV